MVIDSMLDRIKAESTIDIFNFVAYLRSRRTAMVQTEVRKHPFLSCLISATNTSHIIEMVIENFLFTI